MNRYPVPLLLALVALLACQSAGSQKSHVVKLGTVISLAPGEHAVWGEQGIEVQFVGVVEDSRCPLDATCMWAGEVKVQLMIQSRSAGSTRREVLQGQSTTVEEYRVSVGEVSPKPVSTRKIAPGEYRATVMVTQIDRP